MIGADLLVEDAARPVTCEPAGTGPPGLIERGTAAAAGERTLPVGPAARARAEGPLDPGRRPGPEGERRA